MSKLQSPVSLSVRMILCGAAVVASTSCSRDLAAPPSSIPAGPAAVAKAPTALAVTSASPSFGDQGTTVDVHILGSGFASGAQATWLLNGVADAHVHTNSTTFISSTELVANVTIASDAQLAYWDVQVSLASGKNGVGSECFEVTSAQVITPGTVASINDRLQIAGTTPGTSGSTAWFYEDGAGVVSLGTGAAAGLDPLGTVVVGQNGSSVETAWVRQLDNTWHAELLPRPSGSVGGLARAAARTPDGTLLVVGTDEVQGPRKSGSRLKRPLGWRRTAEGLWSDPQLYAIPTGATSAIAHDVNGLEQVVGQLDANGGAIWDSPTSYTVLDAIPNSINSAGTIMVGNRNNGEAVFWWRDKDTHLWHTNSVTLPSLGGSACSSGFARDINDAGVIVGWSCTAAGNHQGTVWLLDFSGAVPVLVGTPTALPGLGYKASESVAASITNVAPYVAAGSAPVSASSRDAVRWNLRQ